MGKALIIAEKPSVARDIASALGGFEKKGDYFESGAYVLSSAIGHLLEIDVPPDQKATKGKWTFAALPVIPTRFDLVPIEKTESRLKLLAHLIKRKDVDCLINACDAGREGELIFRNIVRHTGTKKPIRRLWLQSMTPAAIREGFSSLREDAELRPLAEAAVCRTESDWLIGINATRAMTAFNSKQGGFQLTTVGRVQTPTLVMIVERETMIRKFRPRDYFEVVGHFSCSSGEYKGRWFDEHFSKGADDDAKPERIWDASRAEALAGRCRDKPGVVTEETRPTSKLCPPLFDLTSLQREANSRFGYSAKHTLEAAQSLYERHKLITYPRTDSRALPEDYPQTVRKILDAFGHTAYSSFSSKILSQGWVVPNKRIFNNAKVSDHFAIVPTGQSPRQLKDDEAKIYDMVVRRFLAVFFPPAEYMVTTRITRVETEPYKSEGKVLMKAGWLEVYGKETQLDGDSPCLCAVRKGETVQTIKVEVIKSQTKPPARFTEATLLSAMEGAGKLVEDDELREAMSAKGLGTPATRAAIIEGLIREKYVFREAKSLRPTAKAFSLITLLRGLDIPELCSPELTGNWEFKLKQIERNSMNGSDFMKEIVGITRSIVEKARRYEYDSVPGEFGVLGVPCPKCGGVINETYRRFQCQSCDFAIWKILAGRQFELQEMEELISKREIGPLNDFRSNKGKSFSAMVGLSGEFKLEMRFGAASGAEGGSGEAPDFKDKEPLGKCPKCGSRVFEHGLSYVCENSMNGKGSCDFRSGRMILKQTIDSAQMTKLLSTGRTDLLTNFISRKGRRFRAHLVVNQERNIGFEFVNTKPGEKPTESKQNDEQKTR